MQAWLGICYQFQTGLKLTEIHLPLPPECWRLTLNIVCELSIFIQDFKVLSSLS